MKTEPIRVKDRATGATYHFDGIHFLLTDDDEGIPPKKKKTDQRNNARKPIRKKRKS